MTPPFHAAASGNDCDDADPALAHWLVLYPDGAGAGAGRSTSGVSPSRTIWLSRIDSQPLQRNAINCVVHTGPICDGNGSVQKNDQHTG